MHRYLFNINYNNKVFSIFLNEKNSFYFLEYKDEKYFYPSEEDYLYLNSIYNNKEFVSFKFFNINEKVMIKNTAISLALLTVLNVVNFKKDNKKPQIIYNSDNTFTQDNMIKITSNENLNSILGNNKISVDEVISNAYLNKNISLDDKRRISTVVNTIYNNYPEFDFRIFNENIKNLKIILLSQEEILSKFSNNFMGCYLANDNTIYLNNEANEVVIYHELCHTLFDFYKKEGNNVYYHYNFEGKCLSEAMNSKITSLILNDDSYNAEKSILDFLCYLVNYKVIDYYDKGIDGLSKSLQEKFPNEDISYIILSLDAIYNTSISLNQNIDLEQTDILDKLFNLAILSISEKQKYEPFENFVGIIKNTNVDIKKYFDLYNDYLKEKGYEITKYEKVLNLGNGTYDFAYFDDEFKNIDDVNINKEDYCIVTLDYSSDLFKLFALKNISKINESNYIDLIIKSTKEVSPYLYKEIPFYYKGRFLFSKKITTNMMIEITSGQDDLYSCNLYENDDLIYSGNKNPLYKSDLIPFVEFITKEDDYIERIDLACFLSHDYVNKFNNNILTR